MVQLTPRPIAIEIISIIFVHFFVIIFTESIIVNLFSRADKFAAYYGLSLINNKQRKNATLYMQANIKLRPGTIVYLYID
jgi:hypothetical protein